MLVYINETVEFDRLMILFAMNEIDKRRRKRHREKDEKNGSHLDEHQVAV